MSINNNNNHSGNTSSTGQAEATNRPTRQTDYTHGSQSKPVVLAASLFIAALWITCVYLVIRGPDKESVFFFLRHAVIFYPLMIAGVVLFGRIAIVGFKRLKTL